MRSRGVSVGVLAVCGAVAVSSPASADHCAKPAVVEWARDIGYTPPL